MYLIFNLYFSVSTQSSKLDQWIIKIQWLLLLFAVDHYFLHITAWSTVAQLALWTRSGSSTSSEYWWCWSVADGPWSASTYVRRAVRRLLSAGRPLGTFACRVVRRVRERPCPLARRPRPSTENQLLIYHSFLSVIHLCVPVFISEFFENFSAFQERQNRWQWPVIHATIT